jgi:DNA-binding transcriptional LysR family regulator
MSLLIKDLEEYLGAKLFERLPRKVRLTEEGRIFRDLASPLLDDISALKTKFDEACGKASAGEVKIAAYGSVMVYLLPDVVKSFRYKFPACKLSIVARSREEIIPMVNNGEVDFGIGSLATTPHGIEYDIFARFNRMLIAPKSHPLSRKSSIELDDIAAYPLIIPPATSNTLKEINRVFEKKHIKYTTAMEIVGHAAIKTYVSMGLGISIMNKYYLNDSDKNKLFIKDVSGYFGAADRGIITRKNRYLSVPAREFIKMIHKHIKPY